MIKCVQWLFINLSKDLISGSMLTIFGTYSQFTWTWTPQRSKEWTIWDLRDTGKLHRHIRSFAGMRLGDLASTSHWLFIFFENSGKNLLWRISLKGYSQFMVVGWLLQVSKVYVHFSQNLSIIAALELRLWPFTCISVWLIYRSTYSVCSHLFTN
jgi:hypothetical protein